MRCLAFLLCVLLSSCAYTSLAPVTDANGNQAIIRVPGVTGGGVAKGSQLLAVQEYLSEPFTNQTVMWNYFPELEGQGQEPEIGILGIIGQEVVMKNGRKVAIVLPVVAVRANADPERVDEVATSIAAKCYQRANRKYEMLSENDFKKVEE